MTAADAAIEQNAGVVAASTSLTRRFILDHPSAAAARVEVRDIDEVAPILERQTPATLAVLFRHLAASTGADLLERFPADLAAKLLAELTPNQALPVLAALEEEEQERFLGQMPEQVERELRMLLSYPADSAGQLMDTRLSAFRADMTVDQALAQLRRRRAANARSVFLIDDELRLVGKVAIQDLAVAPVDTPLAALEQPISAVVQPLVTKEEVVETLEKHKLTDIPVVSHDGTLVGVIHHPALIQAIQEDATADIQTMVGASKDEKALSPAIFAVKKRLPWLEINLLTAFMAAAVVGLFEDTIARFTALAVLLPVVAGQSGNAGAQALAVTMRGLALREISMRDWARVTWKEVNVGLMNGLAVAVTCGLGVFVWSGSFGLVVVIAVSMVLAMVAAGFAGALVPIVLTRLGQDPAQASSIVLTTVTDIAGFFSFLGIATLLASML